MQIGPTFSEFIICSVFKVKFSIWEPEKNPNEFDQLAYHSFPQNLWGKKEIGKMT